MDGAHKSLSNGANLPDGLAVPNLPTPGPGTQQDAPKKRTTPGYDKPLGSERYPCIFRVKDSVVYNARDFPKCAETWTTWYHLKQVISPLDRYSVLTRFAQATR